MRAALLSATLLTPMPLLADVNVAVDIAPLHALVAQVMGEVGTPELIVEPGASVHNTSLRPSRARALDQADVVFWVGPTLTPWLDPAVDALAESARVESVMTWPQTQLLGFREGATFEAHDHDDHEAHGHEEDGHKEDGHGHKDEAHDHDDHGHDEHAHDEHKDHDHEDHAEKHDDHAHEEKHDDHAHEDHADHTEEEHAEHHGHDHDDGKDPHVWLSPDNAMAWLPVIATVLSEQDPDNAATYAANASDAVARLTALDAALEGQLASVRGKAFIVTHDAFHYFEAAYDVEAAGAIAASDAAAPGPKRLREIEQTIQDTGATCVFIEPQTNDGWAKAVAGSARIATMDPMGAALTPGPELYAQLLQGLADSLTGCLND